MSIGLKGFFFDYQVFEFFMIVMIELKEMNYGQDFGNVGVYFLFLEVEEKEEKNFEVFIEEEEFSSFKCVAVRVCFYSCSKFVSIKYYFILENSGKLERLRYVFMCLLYGNFVMYI